MSQVDTFIPQISHHQAFFCESFGLYRPFDSPTYVLNNSTKNKLGCPVFNNPSPPGWTTQSPKSWCQVRNWIDVPNPSLGVIFFAVHLSRGPNKMAGSWQPWGSLMVAPSDLLGFICSGCFGKIGSLLGAQNGHEMGVDGHPIIDVLPRFIQMNIL